MLKQSPLLINKIIAERLSDKIQVMMVPSDGKFFFANDVMRASTPIRRCSRRWRAMTMPRLLLRAEGTECGVRLGLLTRAAPV